MRLDVCFALNSNIIQRLKYVRAKNLLEIMFKNGNTHYYHNVPDVIWDEFKDSNSHGKYFYNTIRNKYDFSLELSDFEH
jgi:hypothetical protein